MIGNERRAPELEAEKRLRSPSAPLSARKKDVLGEGTMHDRKNINGEHPEFLLFAQHPCTERALLFEAQAFSPPQSRREGGKAVASRCLEVLVLLHRPHLNYTFFSLVEDLPGCISSGVRDHPGGRRTRYVRVSNANT